MPGARAGSRSEPTRPAWSTYRPSSHSSLGAELRGRTMPSLWICADGYRAVGAARDSHVTGRADSSMTVLGRYLASVSQPDMFSTASGFDEFAAPDGTVRQGWSILAEELDEFAEMDLLQAQREVERLLEDDKVTYTPNPAAAISIADETDGRVPVINEPQPWKLDPLPLILDDREWSRLETGLVQRAELLDAIIADLYGARSLLASGALPPSAIFDHDEYLRPVIGVAGTSPRLFTVAVDLGRNSDGEWKVISDRTQAPSGAGYAMQNRRVVSRVLPEVYQQAHLHRLTPFFQAMRIALVDAA